MTPLYFGQSACRLFGIYHEPVVGLQRNTGVLMCYPLGKEYMRSHWAFRQVATQLVRAGFHVFRFDYRGTGDSADAGGEGDVPSWQEDIVAAAEELRDTAGTRDLALVGLRFGATLAALSSATLRPRDLVLWDPVMSGKRYLDGLRSLHRQLLRCRSYFATPRIDSNDDELLGYSYPTRMAASIDAVELSQVPLKAERVHLMVTQRDTDDAAVRDQLALERDGQLCCHEVDAPGEWNELAQIENALFVGDLPRAICEALLRDR